MKKVKVRLNRPGLKAVAHTGPGAKKLMETVAGSMAGPDVETNVELSSGAKGGQRWRATASSTSRNETKKGAATNALGRARA